jgi:predicted nucleotidyltransferase component of viral defense system
VFPQVDIVRWRAVAPWADDDDVEQDLVITLALFDIFRDESLKAALAFRGGTALHKLHLTPAARYSEDIDLVQRVPGPIDPTLSRLRRVLGWIGPARSETGEHPKLTFRFETETGTTRKVKVEINSHEHFGHVVPRLFTVPDLPVGNSAAVPTYELDKLLATKLRALYQRRKGRDLLDLWWAHQQAAPDPARIVAILSEYQAAAGRPMIRATELRTNLAEKRVPSFLEEVRPLLRPGVGYDPAAALDWAERTFIPLLPDAGRRDHSHR